MATAVTSQKIFGQQKILMWDHDPDASTALITSPDAGTTKRYEALRDYEYFGVLAMATVATTGITKIEIVAATDAAGTDITVVLDSGTIAANAQGDYGVLEVTAAQVREQGSASGKNFTHVGARLTLGTSTDEAAVVYILAGPKFPKADLTASVGL